MSFIHLVGHFPYLHSFLPQTSLRRRQHYPCAPTTVLPIMTESKPLSAWSTSLSQQRVELNSGVTWISPLYLPLLLLPLHKSLLTPSHLPIPPAFHIFPVTIHMETSFPFSFSMLSSISMFPPAGTFWLFCCSPNPSDCALLCIPWLSLQT